MTIKKDGPNPIDIRVGRRITAWRATHGLSAQGLADAIGTATRQQIQKYESGTNRVSASMLSMIATALGVSVIELFDEQDRGGPK